jgi:hypothetical protein
MMKRSCYQHFLGPAPSALVGCTRRGGRVRKFRWVVTLIILVLVTHLGAEDIQLKDGTKMTGN